RLETLVMTAGVELPHRAIREQIASAFDLLVQIQRLVDGSRRVTHITEVLRMESDVITLQDIFVAKPPDEETSSMSRSSRLLTPLMCTGLKPHFLEKMSANGVVLPPAFFEQDDGDLRPAFAAASYGGCMCSVARLAQPRRSRPGPSWLRSRPQTGSRSSPSGTSRCS